MLKTGDTAPAFSLLGDDEKTHSLKEFLGKRVLLYFYPKDNTPGCTLEAIDFTRLASQFAKLGITTIGISPDTFESHCTFRDEHHLSILLLSDPKKEAISAYGAWGTKKNYGKEYIGVIRSTLLIGLDGKIEKVWYNVKATGHAEKILQELS